MAKRKKKTKKKDIHRVIKDADTGSLDQLCRELEVLLELDTDKEYTLKMRKLEEE